MISLIDSPIIKTKYGRIKGRTYSFSDTKHSVASFLGIPYAKSPIGALRFEKPVEPDRWHQIRNCNNFGACCPFIQHAGTDFLPKIPQSEDCLYLNVFAPVNEDNTVKSGLPVLFYIHGGGYVIGNSALCGDIRICKYLCVHDVIVVTINYRLGLFGFLTTGDSNALGNYGLWDQTAALKWTNENINQFGGNPNQITVLGHSAGASSTDLLCISPHSRDLFKNAAPMAGSSFNKWALTQSQKTLNKALKLAQKRGFVSTNLSNQNTELVKFLRKLPADQIKVAAHGLPVLENEDAIAMHVAPVFDGDFFPRPLNELRKEAPKKDILTGVTTFEGLMFATSGISFEKTAKFFISSYIKDRNNVSQIGNIFNSLVPADCVDRDKRCVDIMSDLFISYGTYQMAQYYKHLGGNVFVYTFDHIRPKISGPLENFLPFLGASHGIETAYLFGTSNLSDFQPNLEDETLIRKFTGYFANFAKFGTPENSSKWKPITNANPLKHNVIKLHFDEIRDDFCEKRPLIWQSILEAEKCKL